MKNKKKILLTLLINFLIIEAVYQIALYLERRFYPYTPFTIYAFFILECVLILVYVFASGGNANTLADAESMPSTIPWQDRVERAEKINARKKKVKSLLYIIIPLAIAVGIDFLYIFVISPMYL